MTVKLKMRGSAPVPDFKLAFTLPFPSFETSEKITFDFFFFNRNVICERFDLTNLTAVQSCIHAYTYIYTCSVC